MNRFVSLPVGAQRGYSLLELVAAIGLMTTLTAASVPRVLAQVDQMRAAGAARYVSARLQLARMEAATRDSDVALRFSRTDTGYGWATYRDGNGNGVRARDIAQGIDREIGPFERLSNSFRGVDFGVLPGLPPIEAGDSAPGSDPIKIGSTDILTFGPLGTSTAGTLYILGQSHAQYAVRIFGGTGKVRTLKLDVHARRWSPI
jgi:type II secretory pathway pseudopilin PulG